MVDVSTKTATTRTATATGQVIFPADIYTAIKNADGMTKKGSITQTAYIAGVMGAKSTSDLIPLCHPLPLDSVKMSFDYADSLTLAGAPLDQDYRDRKVYRTSIRAEALLAAQVVHAVHVCLPSAYRRATPIIESRVTSAANWSAVQPSVPAGRIGTTR